MQIAVPLTDEALSEEVGRAASLGADIIELRVDQFKDKSTEHVLECIDLVHSKGLKTILTVRIPQEGGAYVENRLEIFEAAASVSDYTDLELTAREDILKVREFMGNGKLIVSFHDFERTPPLWLLKEVYREAKRFGAHIPKIAVMANSLDDVARLLCLGNEEKGEKILIAMGELGSVSRIAAYAFGSVISYASLERSFAPGQIPLEEMVKLRERFYRV